MKIKSLLLGLILLTTLNSANAAMYGWWTYINESVQGVTKTCYWKREILNSNGTGSGQYQYYNFVIVAMSSCMSHTEKLPK
ncbi:hypothetical protein GCM10025882_30490 [Acinetobacter gyllenbergii]|uniref:Uncharacterized protein n=1 Tax=Acinetobacter gyllenbergii CIP 110306 = MTCC 11365 TaxID=1217657 RepID=A0A829HIF6_9GAMM|nr:hypothetical protein [Acinetobacter gyllenbergii]EPF87872.1 hypothetical protein F957_01159 [Acinetobacter gyllenbergii CIP 110306 = MTCC 11365]EPH36053.1 hypothetical protein L293_0647 [Acinetobacter gyllenbergii CIP 110306 = MTCC 11365]ESK54535.1 hypothetical protein F987_00734 [Acinetobacter gyllenbergii NIPH 230]MCU4582274.1 hypothetical protein [Acinetobacter gyllenbergii]OBY74523.1 hypothetical protein NG55_06105 [Acinetobacter gyllenbergii]